MRNHFQFTWWRYLAAILIPIALWCSVFDMLAQPAKNERLNILYIGNDLDASALQQEITTALPALTDQKIQAVTVDAVASAEMGSASVLTARTFEYDILIFEESSMVPNMGQTIFASFSDRLIASFPDTTLYREDTEAGALVYGLVLYDGSAANHFSACYHGKETCYLMISPKSENFDTLNQNGSSGDDAALKTVQYLLELTP